MGAQSTSQYHHSFHADPIVAGTEKHTQKTMSQGEGHDLALNKPFLLNNAPG